MSHATHAETVQPFGRPAPLVRLFGWGTLGVLTAFFVNNILIVWFGFPHVTSVFAGQADPRALIGLALYAAGLIGAGFWVWSSGNTALRYDARVISDANAYLIRACFFAVLFVGLADVTISFLRVERLLPVLFSEDLAKNLIRVQFVAPNIHVPLVILGFVIAAFTRTLGFHWLAMMIVLAELLIVISRFVFSYEQALMGDLVRYWYAALFLFSSAYTLLEEGHVRVDVFYAGMNPRTKGRTNAVGSILLGMVTAWCIILMAMGTAQSIVNSPVKNLEISQSGTAGMFIKYQMAAFLGIFAITMLIQFVSYLFQAVADVRGEPGRRVPDSPSH